MSNNLDFKTRLVIAQVLAGVTLVLVLTIIIAGPDVMLGGFVQAFGTTADTAGRIGSAVLLVLSAAAHLTFHLNDDHFWWQDCWLPAASYRSRTL